MDEIHAQKEIARRSIEEERRARPVVNLSNTEKRVLRQVDAANPDYSEGFGYRSIEGAALHTLEALGLVTLATCKEGIKARLTEKGRLLLYDNPKLKFPIEENTRWTVSTVIAAIALILSFCSLIIS